MRIGSSTGSHDWRRSIGRRYQSRRHCRLAACRPGLMGRPYSLSLSHTNNEKHHELHQPDPRVADSIHKTPPGRTGSGRKKPPRIEGEEKRPPDKIQDGNSEIENGGLAVPS